VLLEYSLGESRSFAWAIARNRTESFVLPASADIADLARRVYAELQKQPAAALATMRLSQMLLKPLAGELRPKRVVVVADGPLEYIPFAALPDPARPTTSLLSRHEVVHLPSASAFLALRRIQSSTASSKRLAVFADPVFDPGDARVAGAVGRAPVQDSVLGLSLPRLPFSRQEAIAISGLVPPPERKEALGFEATRALFLSPDVGQYKIIHLATHAVLNTEHPDLSGIVLSEVDPSGKHIDGVIRLLDLYQMRLQADLVVLSACETALGKEIRGEGLVGLTRGFMYAGAPRVVASLWKVDDHATAELMRIFYNAMLGPAKLRPAAALRSAQIALSHNPRWASPYYWGAFVLEGDWR
jgi:CHAT domain-containing protein